MAKKVSDSELDELRRLGEVEYDPETREVARFGELIEKLTLMIDAGAERTKADLARSQVQLEILASLQKMMRANVSKTHVSHETIDMEPLKQVLLEIRSMNETKALAYEFDIQRPVDGGPMQRVIATPISPSLN